MPRPPKAKSAAKDSSDAAEGRKSNFAWVQHVIYHLAPQTALRGSAFHQGEASPQVVSEAQDNMAGLAHANGSMSSNQSVKSDIRNDS